MIGKGRNGKKRPVEGGGEMYKIWRLGSAVTLDKKRQLWEFQFINKTLLDHPMGL